MGPLITCLVLMITAQAASSLISDDSTSPSQQLGYQHPAGQRRASQSTASTRTRTRAWLSARTVRGGYQHGSSNRGHGTQKNDQDNDHVPPRGATATADEIDISGDANYDHDNQHNIEKIAADLRAKKDHIATHIHARGEALAADLKAKQEKIADEVLRERSPEALGELGGHASSYDSATAVSTK